VTAGDLPLNFQRLRVIFVGVNDPENTSLRDCDPEENLAGAAGRNLDKRERERERERERDRKALSP